MTIPRIGILAVQGDVVEHVRALERVGARALRVRRPGELAQVDGLVVPGGESTVIDRLTRIFDLRAPLVSRIAGGMPVYGTCAGMILLADRILDGHRDQQTLGGLDVTVRRNAFGRQVDSFEADLDVPALPGDATPFRAIFIRAPRVELAGDGVEVLARIPEDAPQHAGAVVAVRQGPLLATSFHPEVTRDDRWHALFVKMVHESTRPSARGELGQRVEPSG